MALTFDTAPETGYAAQVLDILKQQGIQATFALTGVWAEQNPDLVKRIVSEGHQIINLTYDHKSFTGFSTGQPALTTQQRVDELNRMRDVVKSETGYDVKPYFRPPYGDVDGSVLQDIANNGYSVNVLWSIDTREFKRSDRERNRHVGARSDHAGSDNPDAGRREVAGHVRTSSSDSTAESGRLSL